MADADIMAALPPEFRGGPGAGPAPAGQSMPPVTAGEPMDDPLAMARAELVELFGVPPEAVDALDAYIDAKLTRMGG